MSNQLQEFRTFVQETNGLVVWALGAGVLGALVANFAGISPPWPSAATPITCGAQLLVLMGVFLFYRNTSKKNAQRHFKISVALAGLSLVLYLLFFSLFVFELPTNGSVVVAGFTCLETASEVLANCPFLTLDDLAKASYDVEQLWTKLSITLNRTAVFVLWVTLFSCFIYAAGIFVVYARKQKARAG